MVWQDHLFVVFALYERKKRQTKKYRSAEGLDRQLRKF
jgi:hypothetical protein